MPSFVLRAMLVVVAMATGAAAKFPIQNDWIAYYPGSQSDDNVVAGTGTGCQLCHESAGGGDGWNAYGWALRDRLNLQDTNAQAFANVEALDSDGDPGARANLSEITANAQPGWTTGPVNVIYYKDGTTLSGQLAPSIAVLDPAGGTTSTSTTSTSSTSTTSSTTSTSTSTTTSTSLFGATTSTSTSVTSTTSTSSTTSSSTSTSTTTSTTLPATVCTNPGTPDGTSCDDGDVCTVGDECESGVCVGGPDACGTEIPTASTKLVVVDKEEVAGKAKLVFVSKDPAITKGAGTDPATISAALDVGYDAEDGGFTVETGASDGTAGWLVNKPTVAKFVNKNAPGDPTEAKVAVVKPGKVLKLVGKGLGDRKLDILTAGAPSGDVTVVFSVDNDGELFRHCTAFGECAYKLIAADTGAKLVCKNGVATTCPLPTSPSGAFID